MNLEELQIKIGIELKELNKQLKQASDDINKTLGPKATKKMMTDNNKVIKDGFKVMEKTAKDSAKQINRDLNNAFDISKTMVKFNMDIDRAMEQAKRSVRSACNDIRRELNAALNVNANIRVSASASTTQRQSFGSRTNTAAMVSSNQYTAAMIVKAINGMISAENKNTGRLEGAINKSTNKLVSAISKQQSKDTKIENKIDVKSPEVTVNVPEAKAPEVTIEIPEIKVPDIEIDLSQINESISKLGDELKSAISSLEDVIRLNNGQNKPVEVDSVRKPVVTKEQGGQQATSVFGTPVPSQPKQQPKVFKVQSDDVPHDLNSTTRMARNAFDTAGESVENFIATLELLTAQLNPKRVMGSIIGGTLLETLADNIKVSPAQENVLIGKNISDLQRQKEELECRRDRIVLPGDEKAYPAYRDALNREIEQIEKAIEQLKKSLNPIDLKIPNPDELGAKELEEIIARTKESVAKFNQAIEQQTLKIQQQIKQSQIDFNAKNKPIEKPIITTPKVETGQSIITPPKTEAGGQDPKKIDRATLILAKYRKQAADAKEELKEIVKGLNEMEGEPDTDELDKFYDSIVKIHEQLNKIQLAPDLSKIKNKEIRDAANELAHYRDIAKQLERHIGALKIGSSKGLTNEIDLGNLERRLNDPNKPNIGERNNNSLNFLPHQNGLKNLSKLTEKVGAKIRKALSTAVVIGGLEFGKLPYTARMAMDKTTATLSKFSSKAKNVFSKVKRYASVALHPTAGPAKFDFLLNRIEKTALATFSKIKAKLKGLFSKIPGAGFIGSVKNILTRGLHTIKNYRYVYKKHLNKIFDGIKSTKLAKSINKMFDGIKSTKLYKNITKGLNKALEKAKKSLSKFVSNCKKTIMKLPSIFAKSVKASLSAIGKLATGLKSLLGKMLKAVSAFAIAGVALIAKSQTLAQSEAKLTVLMKQRMGATKETVKAIRELAEEQANLGVVSETAMVRGAEQLSRYVHSAKALQTLMPAIANMTALRGGFNATPEDAEEIATQLGEAIREGTTTPLEQSGIYLSEAEIEKFSKLRTEEARAEFLADEIAKSVGNLNEQLANTPHGAIAQLKNNFSSLLSTLGTFLANVIQPIVKWLNVLVVAANNALKALGELLGFDMTGGGLSGVDLGTGSGGGAGTGTDTSGIDGATDSLEDAKDAAGEAEEAVEKFKGSLMGFDEINILSDNTNKKEDDPTNITPGEGGQLNPGEYIPTELTEAENIFSKFGEKMKAFIDEVLEPFKKAWELYGNDLKEEWADLKESFKNFCDSLASFLKSVWDNGGKEFVQHLAEIGLACGKAAMEIGGEILDSLARLWDHLDPSKNMHTQRLLDVLNEVSEKIRDFILGLGDHFESLMANGGQDVLNAMGDCFMDLGAAAVNGLGVAIDALDGLIDHLDPAVNENTRNMLQALADMFHATGQAAWDFSELLKSALANGGQDMINAFGDMMMNLGETVARVITTMMESFSKFFEYIDPENNDITKNMMKSWEEAFLAIGDAALGFADLFESVMDNGGQEVLNKFGDAVNSLVGLVGDCVKEIADALDGLFEHLDPKTNQFTKDFLKAWEDAFNSIADMFGSLGDLLGSAMDNGGQELLNSVGDLGMKLGEAFGVIVDEVAKTLSELFTHMDPATNPHSKKMLDSLDGLVDSITKFVDACIDAFKRFMDNGGREFVTNLGDILAIVIDLAAELGSGIIDVITAFINSWAGQTLIEGVAQALAWVSEKLVGLADSFDIVKDMFHNIVDMIIAVFEGDGEKLGQAFAKLIKNTFKLTGELVVWLGEVAADLIKGLVEGICALPGLLWEAVKFIFDAIVGFFKELFGIHSPSTVFADLGKNLIEGLVKGVTDCVNLVTGAFKKVCDAITNTIKDISKAVSDKFKEIKDGISEKLKETKEVVSEKWSEIKTTVSEKAKETYDAARDNWANLKQTVSERARETYEAVKGNWENLKQNTADRFKETYDVAQERFTNIREAIKEKATKTFEDVSNSWTKIKEDAGNKLEQIKTDAEKRYEDVKNTLVNKIEEAKKGIVEKWEEVRNKTNECIENVRQTSEEKYNEIKETIVNRLEDIKSSTEKKWEEIKKNTGTAVENIKKEAEEQYGKIKDSLLDTLEKTKSAMATKWENIKTDAINKVSEIVKQATTKFGEIKKNFGDKLDEVKSSLTSKWKSLSTQAFDGAKNMVSQAKSGLSKIGSTISDAITGSKSKVKSALNEVGKVFSQADWSLPKLKMPHIKITGKWGFNPPSWPKFSVEWYKRGGIIDGITPLGMTGGTMHMAGEAGKEMVVPLENTSFTTKIAKAMGQAVDNAMARNNNNNNSNSNPFVNNNGDIILQVDGREFARCSINQINKLQRESGRTLLDV